MAEKKFAKGFYGKQPRQGAPDYVRATISIKVEDAINWLKENANQKGYVNLDVLDSKTKQGELSISLNEYQPQASSENIPF